MGLQKPRRREGITVESLPDGSAVLYDDSRKQAFPLSSSGARIWEICDGTRTPNAIASELEAIYDAPRDVIDRDVDAFLKQLEELELLEGTSGDSP